MRVIAAIAILVCSCGSAAMTAEPWTEADTLFRSDPRWLGADGALTIPLGGQRTLWLFGDTFVATSAANVRGESEMVRNTIALQTGLDPRSASMEFRWAIGADGTPASFFSEDG